MPPSRVPSQQPDQHRAGLHGRNPRLRPPFLVRPLRRRRREVMDAVVLGDTRDEAPTSAPDLTRPAAEGRRHGAARGGRGREGRLRRLHPRGCRGLLPADAGHGRRPGQRDRAGGGLRPGPGRTAVRHRRRGDRTGQRHPYGLAASAWTTDVVRAHRASREIQAGCVWINDHIPIVSEMPHGGFKQSGFGKDMSSTPSRSTPRSSTSHWTSPARAHKPWHRTIFTATPKGRIRSPRRTRGRVPQARDVTPWLPGHGRGRRSRVPGRLRNPGRDREQPAGPGRRRQQDHRVGQLDPVPGLRRGVPDLPDAGAPSRRRPATPSSTARTSTTTCRSTARWHRSWPTARTSGTTS
jgi:hypothetical protein